MRIGAICTLTLVVAVACRHYEAARPPSDARVVAVPVVGSTPSASGPSELPAAQELLGALLRLEGDLARHLMRVRALDAEFEERITAIYGGEHLRVARENFAKDAAIGFAGYAGGDPTATVVRIVDSSSDCLVIEADVDPQPLYTTPVRLKRGDIHQLGRADVERFNQTGWGIVAMGAPRPGSRLEVCE